MTIFFCIPHALLIHFANEKSCLRASSLLGGCTGRIGCDLFNSFENFGLRPLNILVGCVFPGVAQFYLPAQASLSPCTPAVSERRRRVPLRSGLTHRSYAKSSKPSPRRHRSLPVSTYPLSIFLLILS